MANTAEPTEMVETELAEPVAGTVTETETEEQQEFDEARAMDLIKKQRVEIKNLTKQAKRANELEALEQQRSDAEKSELQKLQEQLAKTEAALKERERLDMARDAAHKANLPEVFADRIRGETPDEMLADGTAIAEALPKKTAPQLSTTNPSVGSTGETDAQKRRRLLG